LPVLQNIEILVLDLTFFPWVYRLFND